MKSVKIFILILLTLVCTINAQNKTNDVLTKLQQKFNVINDLTADFKQAVTGLDAKGGLAGKYFYKKKDLFRIELKSLIIVSDGKETWNYNVKTKKYIVNNYEPNDPSNLSLYRFVFDYPVKCKVTLGANQKVNGSDCIVIELVPNKGELNFKKAKLYKDDNDLIKRISFEEQSGSNVTIDLSNIKINQNLPDSKFKLTPPEGSKIIDLR